MSPTPSTEAGLIASIRATFAAAGRPEPEHAAGAAQWLIAWGGPNLDIDRALRWSDDGDSRGISSPGRGCLVDYRQALAETDPVRRAADLRQQAARLDYHLEVAERAGEHTLRYVRVLKADPTFSGARIKITELRAEAALIEAEQPVLRHASRRAA